MVEALWGGELPPFDSIDEANELIGALIMGLWNANTRLTVHQGVRPGLMHNITPRLSSRTSYRVDA